MSRRASARLLVGLTLALVVSTCASAPDCERIPSVRPGVCPLPVADRAPVPDVALPVIVADAARDADPQVGREVLSLADLEGRVVVMNFWASWCGPCRVEQPDLNDAWDLFPPDEVVVVGVNIEDTRANALAHLEEFAVPYVSLFDPVNELAGRFSGIGARTIPTTLFLDRVGKTRAFWLAI